MTTIGITGASEFVGRAVRRELHLHEEYKVVLLGDTAEDFSRVDAVCLASCDRIVHCAVLARSSVPGEVGAENPRMARALCDALAAAKAAPDIVYVSSVRENDASEYGRSRADARRILENFAAMNHSTVTTLKLPNEFGPCGRADYNSVVTTFCTRLIAGATPQITQDAELDLVYVGTVAEKIAEMLAEKSCNREITLAADRKMRVSELLQKLTDFQRNYGEKGILPVLLDDFDVALFNTYRSYLDPEKFFPHPLATHGDARGVFVELVKQKGGSGQFSFSSTAESGVPRGEHFHTRKIERFMVLRGKAKMTIRAIDSDRRYEFQLDGEKAAFVDVPIWYTHNLVNTGGEELLTAFWINEIYDPDNPDTYREKV